MLSKSQFNLLIWVILLIIILVLMGIILSLFFYQPIKPEVWQPARLLPPLRVAEEKTATGLTIPAEVYVYTGVVKNVTGNYLLVFAQSHNNYLVNDEQLTVFLDQNTKFVRYLLPKTIAAETTEVKITEAPIRLQDLKANARVEVYAAENIKGKVTFTAALVKVLDFYQE